MSKLFLRIALAALAIVFPVTALAQPVISAVVNNFSYVSQGLPNYGIAPASTFVIYGSGLCDNVPLVVQTSSGAGLPQKLNGMTISVTVNGVITHPAIYYAIPHQVAAVLPSTTPAGTGTITVNYNDQTGVAPLVVTKSAFGILTANASGSGQVKATNLNYQDITPTASAAPGQLIVLWGSGLGADTANNDRTYPMKQDNLNDATVYIGGVKADVYFAGRSQFPGEDQIDVYVPELGASTASRPATGHHVERASAFDLQRALNWDDTGDSGFQAGCAIAVVVVTNGISSNFGTLPVNPGGGVCSDPLLGITGTNPTSGTVKSGFVLLSKTTVPSSDLDSLKPQAQPSTTGYSAIAEFTSKTGESSVGSDLSIGNCTVYLPGAASGNEMVTVLNAGTSIGLTGGGIAAHLAENAAGEYFEPLPSALTGGTAYTFTGPGGKDVGSFKATITFPAQLDWTNENSITTVTESQGQPITWTGGAADTYVYIGGTSSTSPTGGGLPLSITFACYVPVGNQEFTIPSYVLLSLPKGSGSLGITNGATPVAFTATGISHGVAMASATIDTNVTYK
jgi:uncharacterized protein (TIGR03437 family)